MLEVSVKTGSEILVAGDILLKLISTAGNSARVLISVPRCDEIQYGKNTGSRVSDPIKSGAVVMLQCGQGIIINSLVEIVLCEASRSGVAFEVDAPDHVLNPSSDEERAIDDSANQNTSPIPRRAIRDIAVLRASLRARK